MTGLVGTSVSGLFLFLIAACNVAVLVGIVRVVRRARGGAFDEAELERQLARRGLMNRFYARFTRAIGASWQMYPIGVLFGLGFDTATEVALLFLAAGAATSGLPFYAILCLPVLFAAGMSLLDTLDGSFMGFAYAWALCAAGAQDLLQPRRHHAVDRGRADRRHDRAAVRCSPSRLSLTGGVWNMVDRLDLNTVGFVIVGLFAVTWAGAVAIWRFGRIEERWSTANGKNV